MNLFGKIVEELLTILSVFTICMIGAIYLEWHLNFISDIGTDYIEYGYFSHYNWNYSIAKDGAIVAQIFGKDSLENNAYFHIRHNDGKYTVYFALYDVPERFNLKDGQLFICGEKYRYKRNADVSVIIDSRSINSIICKNRFDVKIDDIGTYRFAPSKGLTIINKPDSV